MEPGPDPRSSIVSAELPVDPPPEEVTAEWQAVGELSEADDGTDPFGLPTGDAYAVVPAEDPWAEEAYDAAPSAYAGEDSGWVVAQDAGEVSGWVDPGNAGEVSYGDGDSGWVDPENAAEVSYGDGDSGWAADTAAGDANLEWEGAQEWAAPQDAVAASYGEDDSGWDVSPDGAAFSEPGWADAYVGEDAGWTPSYEPASYEAPAGGQDAEWTVPQEGARAAFVGMGGDREWGGPHAEPAMAVAGADPGWPAPPDAGADGSGAYPDGSGRDRPKRSSRKIGLALLAVVLLGAAAIVAAGVIDPARTTAGPVGDSAPGTSPVQGRGGGTGVLTAPLDGLGNAVFDLADSATSVRLHAADLGGDLYRISAPAGSGLLPRVVRSGAEVRLFLSHTAQSGTGVVDVAVNATVGWTLHLDAGVAETVLDMGAGKVDGVDLAGGASRIELILPKPHGQLAVRMTGGVDQFLVRLVKLTPVRVQADSGAGEVTVGGSTYRGIARGRSFTANGWGDGTPGVDLQAVAGMAALTVTES